MPVDAAIAVLSLLAALQYWRLIRNAVGQYLLHHIPGYVIVPLFIPTGVLVVLWLVGWLRFEGHREAPDALTSDSSG